MKRTVTYTSYDGTPMTAIVIENPGNKRWMLFWPGFGYTARRPYAKSLLRRLQKKYNLITPDMRAHGRTPGNFTFEDHCEDVLHVTKQVIAEHPKIIVFGHSASANALIVCGNMLPDVEIVMYAPAMNLKHRLSKRTKDLIKNSPRPLDLFFMRAALVLANLKTLNIRATGIWGVATRYGECRIGWDLRPWWNKGLQFEFIYKKVKCRGAIIYATKDDLVVNNERYLKEMQKTGLPLIRTTGLGHHFKAKTVWGRRKKELLLMKAIDQAIKCANGAPSTTVE